MRYGPEQLFDTGIDRTAGIVAIYLGASPVVALVIGGHPATHVTASVMCQVGHNDFLAVSAAQGLVAQFRIGRLARLERKLRRRSTGGFMLEQGHLYLWKCHGQDTLFAKVSFAAQIRRPDPVDVAGASRQYKQRQ